MNNKTLSVNIKEAINHTLSLAMTENEKIVIYKHGGVFDVTTGLQAKFGPERCFDNVLDASTMLGCAIGLAINGIIPICEIQFTGFLFAALQQLGGYAARLRNRTRGQYTCPLVVRTQVGIAPNSFEHHSEALEAILAHIPGLKVVMPSNPYDAKGLLLAAINDPDPVIFLESKRLYTEFKTEIPAAKFEITIGTAKIVQEGQDLTVVSYGSCVIDSHRAIKKLTKKYPYYQIELIDLRSIKPWDEALVIKSVQKTKKLLVIHEAVQSFSVASEIMATIIEKCWDILLLPPQRLCSPDITIRYEKTSPLYEINENIISDKILELLITTRKKKHKLNNI